MRRNLIAAGASALVLAGVGVGTGIALAGGGGEEGGSASDPAARAATIAALSATGGGTANAVERDSENGATWEVEVTRADGATVDVRLDANYHVVVIEGDHEDHGGEGDG